MPKIKAKSFNGMEIYPEVDVFINFNKKDELLPDFIYSRLKEKIEKKLNRKDIKFEVISKDLNELIKKNIEIIWEDFEEKILNMINDIEEIKNPLLKRVNNFLEEDKIKEAKYVFSEIKIDDLSQFEKDEYRLLEFILKEEKNDEEFYTEVKYFKKNPLMLKKLYFHMIKFSQDKRDEKLPKKLISNFEEDFSIEELSNKEKSIYFYLKGRTLYYRGEFIEAIRNLKQAKNFATDEILLANIYNTSANIFTDNLYFDEAINLANKALEIRKKLYLEKKLNHTYSLIGGIYLKMNDLENAYKFFKKVKFKDLDEKEYSRINNYLAKTSILKGDLETAKKHINNAKKYKDEKGFTRVIEMLYLFKKGEDIKKYFEEEFVLPEKRKNVDAIVWGSVYAILAESYFKEKKYDDMMISLYRGISYLLEDNYILEAYYLSFYPYIFKVKKDLSLFSSFKLESKMAEYVYKHKEILKQEAKEFGIEIKSDNLDEFYKMLINKDFSKSYNLF